MAQFDVNLRDLYRVLRRRLRIFLLVPLLMGLATFFFTEEPPPIYQAESLVKVTRSSTLAGLMVDMISYSAYDNMATQVMVATSQPVLQEVARRISRLGEPGDIQEIIDRLKGQLSAEQRGTSDIITIKASASTPAQSILLANTTAEVYVQQSSAEK
jgi:capsular polysaccharide biosynthesis protein